MFETKNKVVDLDINDVLPNRFQPRVKFNEDAIIELAESIKEHGIIQPIIVRPIGNKYEIIAGERRYKASILAGKETIPSIITDLNDKDSAEIALIENVQRKNLTPIEEAVSYKKILDMGLTQEQLALKLGKSQSSIANKMRLLNLSDDVQDALIEEKISERHARSLLKLTNIEMQNEMLNRIINERLTVRKTDEEIEKMKENMGGVAEVDSVVNTGAFNNNNPGFVDVAKIENEAKEIPTTTSNEPKKFDLAALLQPDTGTYNQPAPQPKQDDFKSSIFGLFGKKNEEPVAPVTRAPEEEKPIYEPLSKENSTFIPLDRFENNNVDDYDLKPSTPSDSKPLDLSSFNIRSNYDDSFNKVEEPVAPVVPEPVVPEPVAPVAPTPVVPEVKVETPIVPEVKVEMPATPAPVDEPDIIIPSIAQREEPKIEKQSEFISSYKPIPQFSFDEPEMPTIDLSQLKNISLDSPSKTSNTDSDLIIDTPTKKEPEVQVETPVVPETKSESINEVKPTPIIVSDYDKQYDPVVPTKPTESASKPAFKDILFSIRDNVDNIEKAGYYVDTDEIDLGTDYRIIITIKKDGN